MERGSETLQRSARNWGYYVRKEMDGFGNEKINFL